MKLSSLTTLAIVTLFITSHYAATTIAMESTPLPVTEHMNSKSKELDALTAEEIARLMNQEDQAITLAIAPCIQQISLAIEKIAEAFRNGARLIYIGAGSSGRLGVLDASECVPTFSAPLGQVVGLIAGGDRALRTSIEGAEDNGEAGINDLKSITLTQQDIVCGISASGSAKYVADALRYAKSIGCFTIFLGCNSKAAIGKEVDCCIAAEVGPEVLTGSTRLKAGTATKMILNMLTTGAFVRYGKVYKNLMVDVKPVNNKLVDRCHRIIAEILNIEQHEAKKLFETAGNDVKTAILMHTLTLSKEEAQAILQTNNGLLRQSIKRARV